MGEYMSTETLAKMADEVIKAIETDSDASRETIAGVTSGILAATNLLVDIHRIAASLETLAYIEHKRAQKDGVI